MRLLVDGDIITYRAGFAEDKTMYDVFLSAQSACPDFSSTSYKEVQGFIKENEDRVDGVEIARSPLKVETAAVLGNAKHTLEKLADNLGPECVSVYLDGEGNYRNDVATFKKYKGNRDQMRRPSKYNELRQYLVDHWGAILVTGEETDDALGKEQDVGSTIICSIDKDLLQIPGHHYNFVKELHTTTSPEYGEYLFWCQVLTGDASDNIFGCPSIGPKTAGKILKGSKNWWRAIVDTYTKKLPAKLPEGMFFENNLLVYPHWDTGKTVQKTIEEYVEEVATLVFIKRKGQEVWQKPMTM